MTTALKLPCRTSWTVPHLLERSRMFGSERPILLDLGKDRCIPHGVFLNTIAGMACALADRFHPRSRIAVLLSNRVEYFLLRYALSCAGLVEVAVNVAHRGVVLKHMLEISRPQAIVIEDQYVKTVNAAGFDAGKLMVLDESDLAHLIALSVPWEQRPQVDIKPEDTARILFTSGTTGHSKAVAISHGYEVYTGERHTDLIDIGPDDRWLCVTPMFHIDAVYISSILLHTGGMFALAPNFSASRFWQDAERSRATYLCYVGAILAILSKSNLTSVENSLRVAVGGGATKAQIEQFEAQFGIQVLEAFAMTECIACTFNRFDGRRLGSVGRPIDGYNVRVVDENDLPLPAGATGEIVVSAKEPLGLFSEYFGNPEATRIAFRGGFFHTGDLGSFDNDGFLYYRGRLKDAIRVRGENVSALELEGIVDLHPAVLCSAAIGVPSELADEDILLYLVVGEGLCLDPEELCAFVAARAARFMVPRYIQFVDDFRRTATQKIDKTSLSRAVDSRTWQRT